MERCLAAAAGEPVGQAFHDGVIVHLDVHYRCQPPLQFVHDLRQRLRLGGGAGEAVQDESAVMVEVFQAVLHHGLGDVVRHQFPVVDVGFCQPPEIGLGMDVVAEDITGGDVVQAEMPCQVLGLGALAGTRAAQQHDIQRAPGFAGADGGDGSLEGLDFVQFLGRGEGRDSPLNGIHGVGDGLVYLVHRSLAVHDQQLPRFRVMIQQRLQGAVGGADARPHDGRDVVVPGMQFTPAQVAATLHRRRTVLHMVGGLTGAADDPPRQAPGDFLVRHLQVDRRPEAAVLDPGQVVQQVGLVTGPGKTVEQDFLAGHYLDHPFLDQRADHLVGHELPGIHVLPGQESQCRSLLQGIAEQVSG